jgi:hypothetical protein
MKLIFPTVGHKNCLILVNKCYMFRLKKIKHLVDKYEKRDFVSDCEKHNFNYDIIQRAESK